MTIRLPSRLTLSVLLAAAPLAGCMTPPPVAQVLSPDQSTALSQVQDYLNGLTRFAARFAQSGQQGYADGLVWLQRPGDLRVEYMVPGPKLLIAHAGRLLYVDGSNGSTTTLPVSRTPLDILLAPSITLTGPVTVTRVQRDPASLQIGLVKTATPGQGTLTLTFAAQPLALTGVTITDRDGRVTDLALTDLNRTATIDPGLFIYTPPPPAS